MTFGGEIELDPGLLTVTGTSTCGSGAERLATGRTALALIARAGAAEGRRRVWLPSYMCDSVIAPFRQAGLDVAFYPVSEALCPVLDAFSAELSRARGAVVLVIHYFGWPTGVRACEDIKTACPDVWLIEDCSHGSLLEPVCPAIGAAGDFVMTSCRKYLPLPDGALLFNRIGVPLARVTGEADPFVRRRLLAKLLRFDRVHGGADDLEPVYLRLFADAEQELQANIPMTAMSAISARLLATMDLRAAMARRRANADAVLEAFRFEPRLAAAQQPLFGELPLSGSPLVFPVRVLHGLRDRLRAALLARRVFCPVHWPLPGDLPRGRFHAAEALAADILGFPIDQRYSIANMYELIGRIVDAVRSVSDE